MPSPKPPALEALRLLLEEASSPLPEVFEKKMFGCNAFFAGDSIYGLIWKEGRIGLKITDPDRYREALALSGAAAWKVHERTMSHWVLLPEEFHDDPERLAAWTREAHAAAYGGKGSAKGLRAALVKTTEKPAAKKGVRKRVAKPDK